MRQSSARWSGSLSVAHRWCAAAWIIGALIAPPLEGAAYAVLLPVALIRFRAFLEFLALHPRMRLVVVSYAAVLSWVLLSQLWSSDGAEGKLYVRSMVVPFLVVHAALSRQCMVGVLFWPGAIWSAVLVANWVGLPVPHAIQPDHPGRASLALIMMGCAAFWGAIDRGEARSWLRPAFGLAVWLFGTAVSGSRASVVSVSGGVLAGIVLRGRSCSHVNGAVWPVLTAAIVVAPALMWTPLGSKLVATPSKFLGTSMVQHTLFDGVDRVLSSRLGMWDWTLRESSHEFVGHGARSWHHDFKKACAAGAPRSSLVTRINPALGKLDHAHSVLIQVMYEQGLVGVALLIGFVAAVGEVAWHALSSRVGFLLTVVFAAIVIMSFVEGALVTRASAAELTILIALASVDPTTPKPR